MSGLFRNSDSDPTSQPPVNTDPPRCTALAFLVAFASSRLKTYSPGAFTVDPNKVDPVAGSGGYSAVEIKQTRRREVVAVKQPKTPFVRHGDGDAFRRHFEDFTVELKILTHPRLREHPNILDVIGIFLYESFGSPHLSLVVEYAALGSLATFLKNRSQQLPIATRARLAIQVGRGLQAVHSLRVCHGDVKIENALVFGTEAAWVAKLCDFGQSRVPIEEDLTGSVLAPMGTRLFTAPEISSREIATEISIDDSIRADVYSFGLLLWEALNDGRRYFHLNWLGADVPPNIEEMEEFISQLAPNGLLLRGKEFVNRQVLQATLRETLLTVLEGSLQDDSRDRKPMGDLIGIWNASEAGMSNENIAQPYQPDETICAWTTRHTLFQVLEKGHENYFLPELVPYSIQEKVVEELESMATSKVISPEARASAAMSLSECYAIGFGYEHDIPQVVKWLRTAAVNGLAKASLWYPRVCKATGVEQLQGSEMSHSRALELKLSMLSTEDYLSHRVRQLNMDVISRLKESIESTGPIARLSLPDETAFSASIAVFNETDVDSVGPLHILVLLGEDEMVKKLLETSPVDSKSERGFNASHYACIGGKLTTLRILIDAGSDVRQRGLHGITPLHLCIFFSNENMRDAVTLLIENGAATDANTPGTKWDAHDLVISGTPMEWAVHTRNGELVQLLLSSSRTQEALHISLQRFYWDIAERLLTKASKGHDRLGESVLVPAVRHPFQHWIAHGEDREAAIRRTVQLSYDHGLFDYKFFGASVLPLAISKARVEGDFHVIQAILSVMTPEAVRETKEKEPWPALAYAITRSKSHSIWTKTLRALLEYYTVAELESDFSNGSTFLHLAVRQDSTVAISALLEKGVNVDVKSVDFFQHTPLQVCMGTAGRKETCNLLVKAGASLEARDLLTGFTPLATMLMGTSDPTMVGLAFEEHHDDVFYIKVLHGLLCPSLSLHVGHHHEMQDAFECLLLQDKMTKYIDEPDESGFTMMQKAAISTDPRNTGILREAGANVAIPFDINRLQLLPLQMACSVGKRQWVANKDDPRCQRTRENSFKVATELLTFHHARDDETFHGTNQLHLARYMRIPQHEVERLITTENLAGLEVKGKWPGLDDEVTPSELMDADLRNYEAAIHTMVHQFALSLGSHLGPGLEWLEDLVIDENFLLSPRTT